MGSGAPCLSDPWRFGIIADTQWPDYGDSTNPNLVGAAFIRQTDSIFIARKVGFVLALGDQADYGYALSEDTRASAAQELYDAHVGFFPVRGNHEAFDFTAAEFLKIYPQTRGGWMNRTPIESRIRIPGFRTPETRFSTDSFRVGEDYSCPTGAGCGLSYSFRHRNATFVLLDQFTAADGTQLSVANQFDWISHSLATRPSGTHAFVLAHEGLIMPDHPDGLLGSDPSQAPDATRDFIRILSSNGVRWFFNGHDHVHSRSILEAPGDTGAKIQDISCASACYKYHFARIPSNDELYDLPAFGRARERLLAQDFGKVGIYVVTVDGSDVEVEHIAADPGSNGGDLSYSPDLTGKWRSRETFGYSLQGSDYLDPGGTSLAGRKSLSATGLEAEILWGTDAGRPAAYDGRRPWRHLSLGWSTDSARREILHVRGLEARMGDTVVSPFALSMEWPVGGMDLSGIDSGKVGVVRLDKAGRWSRDVAARPGTGAAFRVGTWREGDPVGARGVDTLARTAWVVSDRGGSFRVENGLIDTAKGPPPPKPPRSAPSFRQVGARLIVPAEFGGDPISVEYLRPDGSLVGRATGKAPFVAIPSGTGLAIAQLRISDSEPVRGVVYLR